MSPKDIEGLQIRIRDGEGQEQTVTEMPLSLAAGTYRVTGSAPQYRDEPATVVVAAGRGATVTLTMKPLEKTAAPPPPKPEFTMEDWIKSAGPDSGWKRGERQGVWQMQGGELVMAPFSAAAGEYTFTAYPANGKRLEWVVNYRDGKNYELFQLDEKGLTRTRYINGKRSESDKKPHAIRTKEYVTIRIAVTFASVVHSIYEGGQWRVLDNWIIPGGELPGKFGFHAGGKDGISVSFFKFVPN